MKLLWLRWLHGNADQMFLPQLPVLPGHRQRCAGNFSHEYFTRIVAGWCQSAARKQGSEAHNILGYVCESVEEGRGVRKSDKSSVKVHFEFLYQSTRQGSISSKPTQIHLQTPVSAVTVFYHLYNKDPAHFACQGRVPNQCHGEIKEPQKDVCKIPKKGRTITYKINYLRTRFFYFYFFLNLKDALRALNCGISISTW